MLCPRRHWKQWRPKSGERDAPHHTVWRSSWCAGLGPQLLCWGRRLLVCRYPLCCPAFWQISGRPAMMALTASSIAIQERYSPFCWLCTLSIVLRCLYLYKRDSQIILTKWLRSDQNYAMAKANHETSFVHISQIYFRYRY